MGKKQILKTIRGVGNLDYPEVRGVPMTVNDEYGEAIHAEVLGEVEHLVAQEILARKVPLRGAEVVFLRKVLGLSRLQFAHDIGLSDVAVLKWERAKGKRLVPINEIAVRAYFAPKFNIKLAGTFDALVGDASTPDKLIIQYPQRSKKLAA